MLFPTGLILGLLTVFFGVKGSFVPVQQAPQQPGGGNQTADQVNQWNGTISNFLQTNGSFGVLNKLLNDTGLSMALNSTNLTLFAPNDQAFNSLPSWIIERVQNASNSSALPALQALALYHVHPGSDFTPKNFSSPQSNQTVNSTENFASYALTWREYDYLTTISQQGNQTNTTSGNATSISTAMKPLNLTVYTNQQGQKFVNDAEVLSVTNATNGYIFEISKVVTPLYYLNSTIYNMTQAPPQLGSNYTFPQPPASPPEFNLSNSEWRSYSQGIQNEWQGYEHQINELTYAYSLGFY